MATIPNAADEAERLPLREDFMRALTWLLDERKLSQRELADGLGWSSHTKIQPWMQLRAEPRPHEVFAIERYLKVPAGTLSARLGYVPPETTLTSVEEAIAADPFLPDWAKELLRDNYRTIRSNYAHGSGRRKRA